ncbi:hypothetical protein HBI80_012150 [Parastagonospora nodorum]|nr:hypothetical protein HBH49_034330 [Parastagonospora nodorum]KAH4237816.1 hypothetical protein HBI05_126010 [Parastagonospora nodorum]KAH4238112.1 hypothetical protein HBI06_041960 [Parastagonospora nodorum]KAH4912190.1 hypothetical protein HBI80_012150 [Parastagonospora nodorum]KAH5336293.1 hypothetical protein HBI12_029490 [Parastagonospora nodorum]
MPSTVQTSSSLRSTNILVFAWKNYASCELLRVATEPAISPSFTETRSPSPWITSTRTLCVRTTPGHKNVTYERRSTCKRPGCGSFERKIPTSYGMPLMIIMPCFD